MLPPWSIAHTLPGYFSNCLRCEPELYELNGMNLETRIGMQKEMRGSRHGTMLKTVQIIIPSDQTDRIIEELRGLQGLIGLQLQCGGSVYPPGDIITVEVMNHSVPQLARMLEAGGLGRDKQMSMKTIAPLSLVSSGIIPQLEKDTTNATWEEMETLIRNKASANVNTLVLMGVAGAVAGIGLSTGAVHLVIGGMVIAPGFEPFARVSLGVVSRRVAWLQGLLAISAGYLSLIAGSLIVALLLYAISVSPIDGRSTYHASSDLIS
jgi:hypothetical protein